MAVMIPLTTAEHGGNKACGGSSCSVGQCGVDCDCGCPYTGIEEKGRVEEIAVVEQRYPNQWLAFVIPPGENEFAPERGMLVVHSGDDNEVWDAVNRITRNQVVHVYFNGVLSDEYLDWAESEPAPLGARIPAFAPPAHIPHTVFSKHDVIPLSS
jgi:hypothetical protein